MEGETFTRRLKRPNGIIVTIGCRYLTGEQNVELADLFAFLLESTESSRAIARDDDLPDTLSRTIDTLQIEHESTQAVGRRADGNDELQEINRYQGELETERPWL